MNVNPISITMDDKDNVCIERRGEFSDGRNFHMAIGLGGANAGVWCNQSDLIKMRSAIDAFLVANGNVPS